MLILLTPKDVCNEWHQILEVATESLPSTTVINGPEWEWHFFCKTQLDNIQVWKMVEELEPGVMQHTGYIITRCFIDDVFIESYMLLYGFKFYYKPSAEFIRDTYYKLEDWARERKLTRIEALTESPLMSGIAGAVGFHESKHFVKRL